LIGPSNPLTNVIGLLGPLCPKPKRKLERRPLIHCIRHGWVACNVAERRGRCVPCHLCLKLERKLQ
jgi:hypothetical protein